MKREWARCKVSRSMQTYVSPPPAPAPHSQYPFPFSASVRYVFDQFVILFWRLFSVNWHFRVRLVCAVLSRVCVRTSVGPLRPTAGDGTPPLGTDYFLSKTVPHHCPTFCKRSHPKLESTNAQCPPIFLGHEASPFHLSVRTAADLFAARTHGQMHTG